MNTPCVCGYKIASNSKSVIHFTCFLLAFNFDQMVSWPTMVLRFRFQIQLINSFRSLSFLPVFSIIFHRALIKNLVSMFEIMFHYKIQQYLSAVYCSRLHHQNAKQFFKCIVQPICCSRPQNCNVVALDTFNQNQFYKHSVSYTVNAIKFAL